MKRRRYLWTGALAAAALCGVTLMAKDAGPAGQDQPQGNYAALGSSLYKTYCIACHGDSARGDGPLAASLPRKPANLTEIAKRAKGVYPRDLVFRIIDGRVKVQGHGGPDMPVWGDAFMRTTDASDEAAVKHRIEALVDYLQTLQARDAQ